MQNLTLLEKSGNQTVNYRAPLSCFLLTYISKVWKVAGRRKKKSKIGKLNLNLNFYGLYEYLINSISPNSLKFLNIGIAKEKDSIA